jgi:molybdopterin-binding protein
MKLSARNMLKGKVVEIKLGTVMAKVKVDIGNGNILTSLISKESVDDLKLKRGSQVYAIVKSTEVIIAVE